MKTTFLFTESFCLLGLCALLSACGDTSTDNGPGTGGMNAGGAGAAGGAGLAGMSNVGGGNGGAGVAGASNGGTGVGVGASGGMPGASGGMPGASGGMPGASGGMPGASGGMPGASGGMPGASGGMPGASGGMPGASGGAGGGGVGGSGASGSGGAGGAAVVEAMTFPEVQTFLDTPIAGGSSCFDCHESGGCLPQVFKNDDTLYDTLMTFTVPKCGDRTLVVPGDPDNSALYLAISGQCETLPRMPYGCVQDEFNDSCAPDDAIESIRLWILDGAAQQ